MGHGQGRTSSDSGGPVLVGANWFRCRPGQQIRHEHVASVSFIWVVRGSGHITSGGQRHHLTTNAILRLPWMHDVDYLADSRSPFHLGTIHVVPWHELGVPVDARAAHLDADPLFHAPYRRGVAADHPRLLSAGSSPAARGVVTLAGYAVERFLASTPDEHSLRALGTLILAESEAWTRGGEPEAAPTTLEHMTEFVLAHLGRSLTVAEIAEVGGCSVATAERLFSKHTGMSVLAWTRSRRMAEAARLLRTTGLRSNEIARRVGFADPLYFSRVFRHHHGVPPSTYAARQLRP